MQKLCSKSTEHIRRRNKIPCFWLQGVHHIVPFSFFCVALWEWVSREERKNLLVQLIVNPAMTFAFNLQVLYYTTILYRTCQFLVWRNIFAMHCFMDGQKGRKYSSSSLAHKSHMRWNLPSQERLGNMLGKKV